MKLLHTRAIILACAAIVTATPGRAQSPRDRLLVNTTWLKQHLKDPDLVLLQVGDAKEYISEHIAGARFIGMEDLAAPHDHANMKPGELTLELPTAEAARAKLESFGVSDKSRIVVYYGNDWVSPTTRIVLDLDWLGLSDRVSVLDGGMQEWKKQGGAVTAEAPRAARAGKLSVRPVKSVTVDYAWVREHLTDPQYRFIDARARVFYDGVEGRGRKGHIAGATSLPFTEMADDGNHFKSAAELKALFEQAGYKPGQTIVAYCHVGQQGTAVVFAARTLGYNVLLYDGSYTDWETHADAPVENPATPKASQ